MRLTSNGGRSTRWLPAGAAPAGADRAWPLPARRARRWPRPGTGNPASAGWHRRWPTAAARQATASGPSVHPPRGSRANIGSPTAESTSTMRFRERAATRRIGYCLFEATDGKIRRPLRKHHQLGATRHEDRPGVAPDFAGSREVVELIIGLFPSTWHRLHPCVSPPLPHASRHYPGRKAWHRRSFCIEDRVSAPTFRDILVWQPAGAAVESTSHTKRYVPTASGWEHQGIDVAAATNDGSTT